MERDMGFSSKHETVDFEIQTETYVPPACPYPAPPLGGTQYSKEERKCFMAVNIDNNDCLFVLPLT